MQNLNWVNVVIFLTSTLISASEHKPINATVSTEEINFIFRGLYGAIKCNNDTNAMSSSKSHHNWTYQGKSSGQLKTSLYDFLIIIGAEPKHSGTYICWENGTNANNNTAISKHVHTVKVYDIPDIVIAVSEKYLTPKCFSDFNKEISSKYQSLLCSDTPENCPYTVFHDCVTSNITMNSITAFTVEMTSKNFIPPASCAISLKCARYHLAMYLDQLEKHPPTIWNKMVKDIPRLHNWYWYQKELRNTSVLESCQSGFVSYEQLVCVPCEPGEFLKTAKCIACPINTYQDEGGAIESCKPCPVDTITTEPGSYHINKCILNATKTMEKRQEDGHDMTQDKILLEYGISSQYFWVLIAAFLIIVLFIFSVSTIFGVNMCIRHKQVLLAKRYLHEFDNRIQSHPDNHMLKE